MLNLVFKTQAAGLRGVNVTGYRKETVDCLIDKASAAAHAFLNPFSIFIREKSVSKNLRRICCEGKQTYTNVSTKPKIKNCKATLQALTETDCILLRHLILFFYK